MSDAVKKMISSFEAQRQKVRHTYIVLSAIGWPLLIAGIVLAFVSFVLQWPKTVAYISVVLALVGLVLLIVAVTKKSNFSNTVASNLQAEINAELFPNAKYSPNGLSINVLMKPGFFAPPDRYYSKNYMTATFDGIEFEKSHYQFQRRETHTDSHGNTTTTYVDYAVGTMYHFAYGRDFGGIMKVLEKSGFSFLNGKEGMQKVETEFINFNKKFLVLSTDQQLVFYLLTPQIQEKIMSLETLAAGQFYMAFIGDELFIALNDNDQSLRIPFKTPMTEENMEPIVEYMSIPAVFITLLGLNKAKFEKNAGVTAAQ
jgi:hypothetical protein